MKASIFVDGTPRHDKNPFAQISDDRNMYGSCITRVFGPWLCWSFSRRCLAVPQSLFLGDHLSKPNFLGSCPSPYPPQVESHCCQPAKIKIQALKTHETVWIKLLIYRHPLAYSLSSSFFTALCKFLRRNHWRCDFVVHLLQSHSLRLRFSGLEFALERTILPHTNGQHLQGKNGQSSNPDWRRPSQGCRLALQLEHVRMYTESVYYCRC